MTTQFSSTPRAGLHDQDAYLEHLARLHGVAPLDSAAVEAPRVEVLGRHAQPTHTAPRVLTQGQRVSLGSPAATRSRPVVCGPQVVCAALVVGGLGVATAASSSHVVRPGDSLWAIARTHGTSVDALKRANGLRGDTIRVGQRLSVRGAGNVARSSAYRAPLRLSKTRAAQRNAQKAVLFQRLERLQQRRGAAHGRVRAVSNRYVGIRYRLGGMGRGGIDCSAFTSSVMRDLGVRIPRTSRAQFGVGSYVSRAALRAGDLVFFNTLGRGVSHAGIYLGGGMMANANSYRGRVVVESMNSSYWASRFLGGRRVLL